MQDVGHTRYRREITYNVHLDTLSVLFIPPVDQNRVEILLVYFSLSSLLNASFEMIFFRNILRYIMMSR